MSIQLILGPMFAGKTTELLRQGRRAELADKSVLYVKHRSDCLRYAPNDVHSHHVRIHHEPVEGQNVGREALTAAVHLHELWDQMCAPQVQVICIDEGQFFPDLRPVLLHMVNVLKKDVIVAALNATYTQHLFPPVAEVIPIATNIHWLTAVCFNCGCDQATYTRRRPERHLGKEVRLSKTNISITAL